MGSHEASQAGLMMVYSPERSPDPPSVFPGFLNYKNQKPRCPTAGEDGECEPQEGLKETRIGFFGGAPSRKDGPENRADGKTEQTGIKPCSALGPYKLYSRF